jgi:hypothetical protein
VRLAKCEALRKSIVRKYFANIIDHDGLQVWTSACIVPGLPSVVTDLVLSRLYIARARAMFAGFLTGLWILVGGKVLFNRHWLLSSF